MGSLSGGVSVGRTPRIRNALFFLLKCNHFIPDSLRLSVFHFIPYIPDKIIELSRA